MSAKTRQITLALLLLLLTLAVYGEVVTHEFIAYDDDAYVVSNPFVQKGISRATVTWAFTSFHEGNWHPLTWLSHMADVRLFGLNPRGHHAVNLLLHAANSVLLLILFTRMTGALWRSAFVALLFALHPAHVESVAWVAERKDVLSTLFWLLAMLAYVRSVERPGAAGTVLVMLAFSGALMSKPMAVTLPFVLLLMDYWPLGRLAGNNRCSFRILVVEKIPLFFLATVSCALTVLAQSRILAVVPLDALPFPTRLAHAVTAYASYVGKMFWPRNLAVLYPFPATVAPGKVAAAAFLVVTVTAVAIVVRRRIPALPVGWFWFLGTLFPVIGLVQVGQQALADRYTYIPFIGLFLMMAWGIPEAVAGWRQRTWFLAVAGLAVMVSLSVLTRRQVAYWRDSVTLFEHTLRVTTANSVIQVNLGNVLEARGLHAEAVSHYREALRTRPGFAEAHYNLANALFAQQNASEAVMHYREAVRLKPGYGQAHANMGVALQSLGRIPEAMEQYRTALRINPDDFRARSNLDACLLQQKVAAPD
jgi:hypothetical protein